MSFICPYHAILGLQILFPCIGTIYRDKLISKLSLNIKCHCLSLSCQGKIEPLQLLLGWKCMSCQFMVLNGLRWLFNGQTRALTHFNFIKGFNQEIENKYIYHINKFSLHQSHNFTSCHIFQIRSSLLSQSELLEFSNKRNSSCLNQAYGRFSELQEILPILRLKNNDQAKIYYCNYETDYLINFTTA